MIAKRSLETKKKSFSNLLNMSVATPRVDELLKCRVGFPSRFRFVWQLEGLNMAVRSNEMNKQLPFSSDWQRNNNNAETATGSSASSWNRVSETLENTPLTVPFTNSTNKIANFLRRWAAISFPSCLVQFLTGIQPLTCSGHNRMRRMAASENVAHKLINYFRCFIASWISLRFPAAEEEPSRLIY